MGEGLGFAHEGAASENRSYCKHKQTTLAVPSRRYAVVAIRRIKAA